ncbi:hypothetical protein PUN28_016060 [Cardiocondyla obscurior]|uniref:Uncharacterized protein n=1 Tax=Cardiocondyla obscurior TaxID=286306 RepID=A0AAW2EUF6_9HYME
MRGESTACCISSFRLEIRNSNPKRNPKLVSYLDDSWSIAISRMLSRERKTRGAKR